MNGSFASSALALLEFASALVALIFVYRRDRSREYRFLLIFLATKLSAYLVLVPLAIFGGWVLDKNLAYRLYFDLYWADFAIEAALSLVVVWSLFNLAMTPLRGMKDLGQIIFRWIAATSVTMTVAVLCVPGPTGLTYVTRILTGIQRAQGLLTLSLLLFVWSAIRPLGLSARSRSFGVVLSVSVSAAFTLISSGWMAYAREMYTVGDNAKSFANALSLLICAGYFIVPEPKRQMVILPTTSPYFRWNRVAEALGDPPGFVAIAGVPPEMFAPAEIEAMKRASKMMVPSSFAVTHLMRESKPQSA